MLKYASISEIITLDTSITTMNISSKLDSIYYKNRYSLSVTDRQSIIHHYEKVGRDKGYFPNAERERYHLQLSNFDPEYYKRRYNVIGTDEEVRTHWKLHGFSKRNYVNKCEEDMTHHPFMCRCKIITDKKNRQIRNPEYEPEYSIDNSTLRSSVRDPIMTENNRYFFTEKPDQMTDKEMNSRACECTECKQDGIKRINTKHHDSETSDSPTPSELKMQKDIQFNLQNKLVDQSVMPDYSEYKQRRDLPIQSENTSLSEPHEVNVQIVTKDNGDQSIHGLSNLPTALRDQIEQDINRQIGGIGPKKENNLDEASRSDQQYFDYSFCSQCDPINPDDSNYTHTEHRVTEIPPILLASDSDTEPKSDDKSDSDKSSSESEDRTYDTIGTTDTQDTGVLSSLFGGIGQIGRTLGYIFKTSAQESNISHTNVDTSINNNSDPTIIDVDRIQYVDDDSIYTTAVDPKDDDSKSSKSLCDCSVCQNQDDGPLDNECDSVLCTDCQRDNGFNDLGCGCDETDNSAIHIPESNYNTGIIADRDTLIERIISNFNEIESYLKTCEIHLDTIISLMKDILTSLQIVLITSDSSNQLEYDSGRRKIKALLEEVDNITKTVRHHRYPIFSDPKSRSKYIRFPMFYAGRSNRTQLQQIFPDRQEYFTMELINISLRNLRLKRYAFPLLRIGQRMSPYTNAFPATQRDFNREPNKSEYSDPTLARCWNEEHHLKRFERALHRIVLIKEAIKTHVRIVRHQRVECERYKSL